MLIVRSGHLICKTRYELSKTRSSRPFKVSISAAFKSLNAAWYMRLAIEGPSAARAAASNSISRHLLVPEVPPRINSI